MGVFEGSRTLLGHDTSDPNTDVIAVYQQGDCVHRFSAEGTIVASTSIVGGDKARLVVLVRHREGSAERYRLAVVGPRGIERARELPTDVLAPVALVDVARGIVVHTATGLLYVIESSGELRWLTRVVASEVCADRDWVFVNDASYSYGIHVPTGHQVRWREPHVFCRGVLAQPDGRLFTLMRPQDGRASEVLIHDTRAEAEASAVSPPIELQTMARVGPTHAFGWGVDGSGILWEQETHTFTQFCQHVVSLECRRETAVVRSDDAIICINNGVVWRVPEAGPNDKVVAFASRFYRRAHKHVWQARAPRPRGLPRDVEPARLERSSVLVRALRQADPEQVVGLLHNDLRLWASLTADEFALLRQHIDVADHPLIAEIADHRAHYAWHPYPCIQCMRKNVAKAVPVSTLSGVASGVWGRCYSCGTLQPLGSKAHAPRLRVDG